MTDDSQKMSADEVAENLEAPCVYCEKCPFYALQEAIGLHYCKKDHCHGAICVPLEKGGVND